MGLRRIYLDSKDCLPDSGYICIRGDTCHYLKNVLKVSSGDLFKGFDASGNEYLLEVSSLGQASLTTIIREHSFSSGSASCIELYLCQSLPKGRKMDRIISDVSQAGVTKIIPVVSERVIGRYAGGVKEGKNDRWARISAEASKISGSCRIPEITGIMDFRDAVQVHADLSLLFWEGEKAASLASVMDNLNSIEEGFTIKIFVGPEGGYSEEEVGFAEKKGVISVSMGRRILKVETAAVVASALTLYEIESRMQH